MDFGMGMGMAAGYGGAAAAAAAPFVYSMPAAMEALRVDDLLDFSNNDIFSSSSSSSSSVAADANIAPAEQFTAAAAAVSNSDCHYPYHAYFADDIYIPSDEVAELEWLSNFVEDSFSYAPFQSLAANPTAADAPALSADLPVVGRGIRSKRSRGNVAFAAAADSAASSSSSSDFPTPKGGAGRRKHVSPEAAADGSCPAGTRRCTHCASEKTPQWRTGPLGPKTLCNACGVRYKSGRLVPEYRPAASPTFVLTQHSNSHRKVMELRRQKEILILRRQENTSASAAVRPEMLYSDYDVC